MNKSLESLILRVEDIQVKDINNNEEFVFEYAITPNNKLILAGDWYDAKHNSYSEDTILYIFDIDYTSPLLVEEINATTIADVFTEHILNNWNVYEIFKKHVQEYQDKNDWLHKHLHLILELKYIGGYDYYSGATEYDLEYGLFGRLDDDYLIDDLEEFKIKHK